MIIVAWFFLVLAAIQTVIAFEFRVPRLIPFCLLFYIVSFVLMGSV